MIVICYNTGIMAYFDILNLSKLHSYDLHAMGGGRIAFTILKD